MNAPASLPEPDTDPVQRKALRYFNLSRLVIAAVFLVLGTRIGLGSEAPKLFWFSALFYIAAVLALGFPDAENRLGIKRLLVIQGLMDALILNIVMWTSGGYNSGIPVLMMIMLAGYGLIAKERIVLFMAALATLSVLVENVWRDVTNRNESDYFQVALACISFFIIAIMARWLAQRARANASLAASRGAALARQEAINAHIIRDIRDGIIVVRSDGVVRQANPSARMLLGLEHMENRPLADLAPALAEYCRAGEDDGEQLLELGQPRRLLRCRVASRVGADADGRGGNGEGDESDMLVFLTDLEDIQRRMQQIKLVSLGRLTASMAHEIRNPLSAVTQAAELLCEEKRGNIQLRLANIIIDNSRRIEHMIRDVLALGRRDKTQPEALPLAEFVGESLEAFGLGGENEREIFQMEITPDLTLGIDRAHLHQILDNLITNARRYCSGKPGSVKVSAEAAGDGQVRLEVGDDGPGLGGQARAHLFEPFFTSHAKGTGLGLYIARELAEANGFSLEPLDDDPECPGAHFSLTGRSRP
ncbi:MAG: HAMP domain-containing histidine kinase [Azoarcus sp.]|nr:HAMP domain-containing histidine kinase [Azoarcus sp.]